MKLVRTFHPVGHGAFYTERFYNEYGENVANIVFDCGRFEAAKENWCHSLYKTWIEDYVKAQSGFAAGDTVDILFISHFHTDHINGIDFLMKHCTVKKIILPAIDTLTVFDALVYTGVAGGDVDAVHGFFEKCINGDYKGRIIEVAMPENSDSEDGISDEIHTLIHEFKLSKRYIKTVNID